MGNDNDKYNNINIVTGTIVIHTDCCNKNIQIINSYEKKKRENDKVDKDEDNKENYKYENEIKQKCKIKINNKKIKFNYYYKFKEIGKYNIEYLFKENLDKADYMFFKCENLTSIDLSNLNTQNITIMSSMFNDCNSLINKYQKIIYDK